MAALAPADPVANNPGPQDRDPGDNAARDSPFTYAVQFDFAIREFQSQRGTTTAALIEGNTIEDFRIAIWEHVLGHLRRRVIKVFNDDRVLSGYAWAEEASPLIDHMDSYVSFSCPTMKRTVSISAANVTKWRQRCATKRVLCTVCTYTTEVSTKSEFTLLSESLLKGGAVDRAGAAAIEVIATLKARLKEAHKNHYTAADINWGLWANWIMRTIPAGERDNAINSPPPIFFIHLFSAVLEGPADRLANVIQYNAVAIAENASSLAKLRALLSEHDVMIREKRKSEDNFYYRHQRFRARMEAWKSDLEARAEVMAAAANAMAPNENPDAIAALRNVRQQEDIDHAL